jgi:hypothetical protein
METGTLQRVVRAGRRLRWVVRIMVALTAGGVVAMLVVKGPLGLVKIPEGIEVRSTRLSPLGSLAVVAVGLLEPATWLWAAAILDRLFSLYARGIVLAPQNVSLIRRLGWVVVAIDGVKMLTVSLTGVVLTLVGATRPYFTVGVQFSVLLVGLFIVAIARVMEMGRELQENDQLTV